MRKILKTVLEILRGKRDGGERIQTLLAMRSTNQHSTEQNKYGCIDGILFTQIQCDSLQCMCRQYE